MTYNPSSLEERDADALSAHHQERFQSLGRLLVASEPLVFIQDRAGRRVYISPAEASQGMICDLNTLTDILDYWEEKRTQAIRTGLTVRGDIPALKRDRTTPDYEYTFAPLHNPAGEIDATLCTIQAVERHETAASRYRHLVTSNILGITTLNADWHFTEANDAFLQIIGHTQDEIESGRVGWDAVTPPEWHAAHCQLCQDIVETGVSSLHEKELLHKDGTRVPVLVGGARMDDAQNGVIGFVIDLTAQKQAEQQKAESIRDYIVVLEYQKHELEKANANLEALASQDGLTGLKNQRALAEWLDMAFEHSVRYQTPLSLVILDVDHFKLYNDSFGHPAGNAALRQLAQIVQEHARKTDFVARYGGEEFVIVLPHTDADGAVVITERIQAAIAEAPWERRLVSASFGIATLTVDVPDPVALLARADTALYRSKAHGRNRITLA